VNLGGSEQRLEGSPDNCSNESIVDGSNYARLNEQTRLMPSDGVQCSGPRGKQAKAYPLSAFVSSTPLPPLASFAPSSPLSLSFFPRPHHAHTPPQPISSSKLRLARRPRHTHLATCLSLDIQHGLSPSPSAPCHPPNQPFAPRSSCP